MNNIIINPYNEKNINITSLHIISILKKFNIDIDIEVNNLHIYQESFTHKSYIKKEYINMVNIKDEKCIELQDISNEREEFLGDTVIKCIIAEYLYKRYYEEDEGFMTRLKTKLEDTRSLSIYARRLSLDSYILISKQIEDNGGRNSDKLLEDVFEAFIGALYLDQGFEVCKTLLRAILESEIDYSEILYKDTNYKDRLLRFYHSNKWSHPNYILIKEEYISNKKFYTMGVKDHLDNIIAKASDTSKKRAEQKACAYALVKFNQICEDQLIDLDIDAVDDV
jgi:ribonuclease-3